jgi:hypothetical protein
MRYWYDTEFIDDGKTIDLVSIGIVAEDGREYYAVSDAFDVRKFCANPWLLEHVAPSLPLDKCGPGCRCMNGFHLDRDHPDVRSRGQIARAIREFLAIDLDDLGDGAEAELWSWYASYDHVALAQLWGPMSGLPAGIPKRTNGIEQEYERLEIAGMHPEPPAGQHNALVDAHYHRRLHAFVLDRAADQYAALCEALKSSWRVE